MCNRDYRGGGRRVMGSYCLISTEVLFGKMKIILAMASVDPCVTL